MKSLYLILLAISLSFVSSAQYGSIEGAAKDEKGEPLIGAIVDVLLDGIRRGGSATDYDGNYSVKPLPPGTYEVIARYTGYQTRRIVKVPVTADRITTVNVHFEPSAIQEIVITMQSHW